VFLSHALTDWPQVLAANDMEAPQAALPPRHSAGISSSQSQHDLERMYTSWVKVLIDDGIDFMLHCPVGCIIVMASATTTSNAATSIILCKAMDPVYIQLPACTIVMK